MMVGKLWRVLAVVALVHCGPGNEGDGTGSPATAPVTPTNGTPLADAGAQVQACSNGITLGESHCPYGGNTLKLCTTKGTALYGKELVCSGTTPSCAAQVVNGVPYAACCPSGNVGNPKDSACHQ